jgi:hypothetical protein
MQNLSDIPYNEHYLKYTKTTTPTEALALDILNAYFTNTYGPGHQFSHFNLLTTEQKSLAMQMCKAVKYFELDGTYLDLLNDIERCQEGNISARALATRLWTKMIH